MRKHEITDSRDRRLHSNPTIADVAREAGVSKSTASVVLGNSPGVPVAPATRAKIHDAAKQLGFVRSGLAVALSTGRTYTIGLVMETAPDRPGSEGLSDYSKDVLAAVASACAVCGLRLTAILQRGDHAFDPREVIDGRVDGVILLSQRNDDFARQVFGSKVPAVSIGAGYSELRVAIDNVAAVGEAVDHLVSLGHESLGFVTYPTGQSGITQEERILGFQQSVSLRGIKGAVYGLEEAVGVLTTSNRPTAFIGYNDSVAWHLLKACRTIRIQVPEQVSIIGFDDSVVARYSNPGITSIKNPIDAQAKLAVDLITRIWKGENPAPPARLSTTLVIRNSTSPCSIPTGVEHEPDKEKS